jgi:hypothetical protein
MKLLLVLLLAMTGCSMSDERTRCIDRGGKAIYETVDDQPLMVQCAGMRGDGEG